MLNEVEIRFRISSKEIDNIIKIFSFYNAERVFENDSYFCLKQYIVKGKSASELSPHILRLRNSAKGYLLSFKSFTEDKTSWIEEECKIDNIESFEKILNYIGYGRFLSINKERYFFSYKNITFNLDYVDKLGSFLELELFSNDINIAKKELLKITEEMFEIDPNHKIDIGYVQLMEEYIQGENIEDRS